MPDASVRRVDHHPFYRATMSATSDWVTPSTRPELIESLVSGVGRCHFLYPYSENFSSISDRYNPSNVGILEDYLFHQIRSREYDCLANLAILKLSVPFIFPFH
jgi:translation initiation factor 3 subunit K